LISTSTLFLRAAVVIFCTVFMSAWGSGRLVRMVGTAAATSAALCMTLTPARFASRRRVGLVWNPTHPQPPPPRFLAMPPPLIPGPLTPTAPLVLLTAIHRLSDAESHRLRPVPSYALGVRLSSRASMQGDFKARP